MIDPKDLAAWLAQEPLESDIEFKNGGAYIPIEVIKPRLDMLDENWGTRNFKHFYFQPHDGTFRVSGSVELTIEYRAIIVKDGTEYVKPVTRILTGSTTFDTQEYELSGNTHFAETCLSLCIVSAAKNIAPFFGKNLNKNIPIVADTRKDKISHTLKKLK